MAAYSTIRTSRLFPVSVTILVQLSFLFSIPAMVLSVINDDRVAQGLGLTAVLLTYFFHLNIIALTHCAAMALHCKPGTPLPLQIPRYFTTTGTFCCYALGIFWFMCFAIQIRRQYIIGPHLPFISAELNTPSHFSVEVAELAMMGIEGVCAMILALYSTAMLRRIDKQESKTHTITSPKNGTIQNIRKMEETQERSRFSEDSFLRPPAPARKKVYSLSKGPIFSPLRMATTTPHGYITDHNR
ncbi:hypothetical protein BDP27DRAFT_1321021 [Rhodocollybia butyracea]|uniref:Uncharacterized protein n=1 Tax=Rhodocollybia butyracea TaxID=206335 RepID=A0A9P5PTJ0_9AGAR|nr:hypothetical protein BDP27DRAFT_1321021 [Rhodocollybia butyracea]